MSSQGSSSTPLRRPHERSTPTDDFSRPLGTLAYDLGSNGMGAVLRLAAEKGRRCSHEENHQNTTDDLSQE